MGHQHDITTIVHYVHGIRLYCSFTKRINVSTLITPTLGLATMSIRLYWTLLMTLGFKYATAGISSLLMLSIIPLTLSGILTNETITS